MWDPAERVKDPATFGAGYDAVVRQIGTLAAQFGRPVLLLEGDSHVWRVDTPFTPGSPLFTMHPNTPVAPNVTRLVVDGSSSLVHAAHNQSRPERAALHVDARAARTGAVKLRGWPRGDA